MDSGGRSIVLEVSFAPNINHIPAQLFEVALAGTYRGQIAATVHINGQPCGSWPSWEWKAGRTNLYLKWRSRGEG